MGKGDRKTAKGKRYISSYGNARPKAVARASGSAAAPVAKAAKASAKAPARKAGKKVVAKADWAGAPAARPIRKPRQAGLPFFVEPASAPAASAAPLPARVHRAHRVAAEPVRHSGWTRD